MKIFRLRSYEEWNTHARKMGEEYLRREAIENAFLPRKQEAFRIRGYSYPAGTIVDFDVDFKYSSWGKVNWRETIVCPLTWLHNRLRASLHILDIELAPYPDDTIYITEQTTPLYLYLASKFPNLIGSEYLGPGIKLGEVNNRGIRNEDLTQLTLHNESVHYVMSFDCFEHFPDYEKAISECYRILKPRGKMLWSAPFAQNSERNIVRAMKTPDGLIEHLLKPEYHADPINPDGCLCYTYFGWEILGKIKDSGFSDSYAMLFWSKEFGYLGKEQILFVASK